MSYKSTRRISGSEPGALKVVRDALIANGFTVTASGQNVFTALGPGLHSTKQHPIRGVSKAVVRTRGSTIDVDAELGGATRLGRVVMILPFVLALVLSLVVGLGGRRQPEPEPTPVLYLIGVPLLWIALGPLLAWRVRKRTVGAIEALLESAAVVSRTN